MKKKTARPAEEIPESDGTVAFQVRMDGDLHHRLKEVAETAGISMNQLIQGTLRGAIEQVRIGEARVQPGGFVEVKRQKGCVFFGEEGCEGHRGFVWFGLDFTNRGVVRYQPK